jgi:hypothetical protein
MVSPAQTGELDEASATGLALTVTGKLQELWHPFAFLTVTPMLDMPAAPEVQVIEDVPWPAVIWPLVMFQVYVAPVPALGTDAE